MNLRHTFDQVFRLEVVIAAIVFVLILAVLTFAVVRSGTRWGKTASQKESHPRTESIYLAVVGALAIFLIVVSLTANAAPSSRPRPSLRVQVTGFQWCWRFSYEGTPVTVTGTCVNGSGPTLRIPAGRPVHFDVRSVDVVHSMWVPYLRFKMFAYPDHVNSFTATVQNPGTFHGLCAEFCGLYHYAMDFTLQALPGQAFDAWLRSQESAAR